MGQNFSGPAQKGGAVLLLCVCFRKCDVVNRGFSGYNTRWAKLILPRLIGKSAAAESTVAVTIFFGANDSALKGTVASIYSCDLFSLKAVLQLAERLNVTQAFPPF